MHRLYNIGILLSFFICYMQWSDQHIFIIEAEYELLFKKDFLSSFSHPLILAPALGQLLLLYTLIKPNRKLTLTAIILLGLLVIMITLAGALSGGLYMVLSTIPFIAISVLFFRNYKKLS